MVDIISNSYKSNKPLLEIQNLHTYFYTDEGIVKAVNDFTVNIRKGETLCLVGESGCGKSVTALSIMRLLPKPAGRIVRGKILFQNQDILLFNEAKMRKIRGNRIGMIFQEPMTSLNPLMRIGRQICEAIELHQGVNTHTAMNLGLEMLFKVGIPDPKLRLRDYPHQMSGGMRQRVMIAMAIACNPELIIADEPTTALDVTIQAQILELMVKLKQKSNSSILFITHDLCVVAEIAQTVVVMYAGEIVEYADVFDLFDKPLHPYTMGLMKSRPKIDAIISNDKKLETIPGVVPSLLNLPAGCKFHERCSFKISKCMRSEPNLIEVSPSHFVRCHNYE